MHQAISEFLHRQDSEFTWKILSSAPSETAGVHCIQILLTSQRWQESEAFGVDHPVWKHRLTVYLPEDHSPQPCLLMVNSGTRHDPNLEETPAGQVDGAFLCQLTEAPVAVLRDVPNQPLIFADGTKRVEDDLVALSWKFFLQSPEANRLMPLQWPMVKSVMKAMDAIGELTADSPYPVMEFVLAGASKRGWISWLTAAADQRIMAVIPMVIDVLNVQACVNHHLNVYNGVAEAISDYTDSDHNIVADMDTEAMQLLLEDVDPLSYVDQLYLPKVIINASSDEFFPPDSARFYYHQLPAPCWLRYLPNSSHYLGREPEVNTTELMASAFGALIGENGIPDMQWGLTEQGIEIRVSEEPIQARVWVCHNPDGRDFRKETLLNAGLRYQPAPLKASEQSPWLYQYQLEEQKTGWTAFFIELSFDNGHYPDFVVTSGVRVLPEQY